MLTNTKRKGIRLNDYPYKYLNTNQSKSKVYNIRVLFLFYYPSMKNNN